MKTLLIIFLALLITVAIFAFAIIVAGITFKRFLQWMLEDSIFFYFMTIWMMIAFIGSTILVEISLQLI